ncbi:MAG: 5-(carboxyamino)imidazole ribonucleotide synthase [Gammaproteobacteria bacterium]
MILPGATLGVLGGGQLGRMFTTAALTMGYDVIVLDPDPESPAGRIATKHIAAPYTDAAALDHLARACVAVTTEFENVPAEALETLARHCVVRPDAKAVATTQDRIREKMFLRANGFATAPFAVVRSDADLAGAVSSVGLPAILKVARLGYDGKGQVRIDHVAEAPRAWEAVKREPCVLERLLPLDTEVSVVLARGADGAVACWPAGENTHRNGILDVTVVPARIGAGATRDAEALAQQIAAKLDYVGVMAVEFFVSAGVLRVNEIAPRPHNSGHFTLDACVTSQFEQQVRTLCGLPLGDTRLLSPVAMVNLLGDLWRGGETPPWSSLLAQPNLKLHLYGKREARPGRKMGHFNLVAPTAEQALAQARAIQQTLAGATQ